jgi:glycosyltransferase involved in cell wall biosynthesis
MKYKHKRKLIRITTIPLSLDKLLSGQLRFMQDYYEVIAVSSEKEYLERIGKREGVATHHLEMTRKITPHKDVWALLKLYFYFLKTKPHIVHTHTPKAGIVGMLAAKMAGVPYRLHTVAGLPLLEAEGKKRKLLDFVEKLTYRCATYVLPNSFGLKKIILDLDFTTPQKIKVLANGSSNGIDTTYFSKAHFSFAQKVALRESLQLVDSDFVFVFVGRLVSDKGINEAVSAFKKISITYPHAKFLLVGPLESDLDPLIPETLEAIQHCSGIISVGYQHDVRPYLAISDCLVFPSYREGFPNVVMQAGAMELPSIVSDINGCNEIIVPGENGIIVPPKSELPLLEAMQLLLEDEALRLRLKANSRSMIVERYEQRVVWEAILGEYEGV